MKRYQQPTCSVPDCGRKTKSQNLCAMHWMRFKRRGTTEPNCRAFGTGTIMKSGHISLHVNGQVIYEHVHIAEKALGKKLPAGAQVHHVDLNPANNAPSNLVICPDDAYHKLLHKRQRALDACGHADYRKCWHCKTYDDPLNLRGSKNRLYHIECARVYERQRDRGAKRDKCA